MTNIQDDLFPPMYVVVMVDEPTVKVGRIQFQSCVSPLFLNRFDAMRWQMASGQRGKFRVVPL